MDYLKFHKKRDCFFSYDNQVLLGVISQCGFPFWTLHKKTFLSLYFGQKENILEHSIESRAYWFILKIVRVFPILTSRNRTMSTFIIAKFSPHVRDSSKDMSMLFHSKEAFLLPSVWPGTEFTWALIYKKSLLICFESHQGIPYSHRQTRQKCKHFVNG